jgi:hypothetical protein
MAGAQCWCRDCKGRVVDRRTYVRHGRKDRPDEALRKKRCIELRCPDPSNLCEGNDDTDSDDDEGDEGEEEEVLEYVEEDPLGLLPAHHARLREAREARLGGLAPSDSESESEVEESEEEAEDAEGEPQRCGRADLTAAEVTLLVLDWMCTFKVSTRARTHTVHTHTHTHSHTHTHTNTCTHTHSRIPTHTCTRTYAHTHTYTYTRRLSPQITDTAASVVYGIITMVAPRGVDFKTFNQVRAIIKKCEVDNVQRLEMCPNDCIVYWDSKHLDGVFEYKHAHRTKCPVCNTSRYVTDPTNGAMQAAKVFYYFPVASYLRSLYARPDLAKHLLQGCGERPEVA